jgi:DNA-binding transcriptional regulator YiaG
MTLDQYLTKHSLTCAAFARQISYSSSAVEFWRTHRRIPRPRAMALIKLVTKGKVTANDFMESA